MAVQSRYTDREKQKAALPIYGKISDLCFFIAVMLGVVRIIGDAANIKLGLEPTSWFLLAIGFLLVNIAWLISWAVSWYLNTNK